MPLLQEGEGFLQDGAPAELVAECPDQGFDFVLLEVERADREVVLARDGLERFAAEQGEELLDRNVLHVLLPEELLDDAADFRQDLVGVAGVELEAGDGRILGD